MSPRDACPDILLIGTFARGPKTRSRIEVFRDDIVFRVLNIELFMPIEDDKAIETILRKARTIAVVGASPKPGRDSGVIASFLAGKGYTVIPVNPAYQEVLGMKCYPDLASIGSPVDIVDVFRNPNEVMPIIDEAIATGAKTVWMQLGVINDEAAEKAEGAGIQVIMDRCIAVDHRRLVR
jgi:predicted CoA-binding protein